MAYTKTAWEDLPSTNTPVNATNLNKIENELESLDNGQDISSEFTINESGAITAKKHGNVIYISFFGENKARTSSQILATISTNFRPAANTRGVFVTSNGSAVGNILINASTGQITIEGISSNVTGRVFFQMFYEIA